MVIDRPAINSRFPLRFLAIAVMLTALVLFWMGCSTYSLYKRNSDTYAHLSRIAQLKGTILHLDEVLTMSARMAAATGEPRWEKRYHTFEGKLDAAIKEAVALTTVQHDSAAAATDAANIKLVAMESQSFALVRAGRLDKARQVLFSSEYELQKKIYAAGMEKLTLQLQGIVVADTEAVRQQFFRQVVITIVLLPLLLGGWLIALRVVKQYQVALALANARLSREADTLFELNTSLDAKVAERTRELEKSRAEAVQTSADATAAKTKAEALNQILALEVAEHKKTEKALQKAKEEAERANHAKSEFLSRMSHELRTPLNAILGFGQIMEREDLPPLEAESTAQILMAGRHLLSLINEVLDISRIEAGNMSLSKEPVALREVVGECLDLVRPLADENTITLHCEYAWANGERFVLADRQRLKQALINLLSNAVKYNRPNGQVTVSCALKGRNKIRIDIIDTGIGLCAGDLEKLFSPFERLGATQTRVEGTGLGLALTRLLVEAMDGNLQVESTLGVGSTFSIELPEAEPPDGLYEERGMGERGERVPLPPQKQFTLLCVEDNKSNHVLMERILADRPEISLISALGGEEGLKMAAAHAPDLILLDLHLPGMMGWDVLRYLHRDPQTQDIPVIVISADATQAQIEHLRELGAYTYLTKPLNIRQLMKAIDEVLGMAQAHSTQENRIHAVP